MIVRSRAVARTRPGAGWQRFTERIDLPANFTQGVVNARASSTNRISPSRKAARRFSWFAGPDEMFPRAHYESETAAAMSSVSVHCTLAE